MLIEVPSTALPLLRRLAEAEVRRHRPRTPERRAAAHLWAWLATSATITGARRALDGFGDPRTRADAVRLLKRLAADAATPTMTGD